MSNKKLALVWDPVEAGKAIDAVYEKRETTSRKLADYDDTLLKLLVEAKANYDGPFKEFVEKHTHISLTTAKRTLRIADGRGEEVRKQERERKQRQRDRDDEGRDNPPVTPSLQEATQAEANKQGRPVDMLVDDGAVIRVEPEVTPLIPEPGEQFPLIDRSLADRSLADIDRMFPGIEDYRNKVVFTFDSGDVDLEFYDTLDRVSDKLKVMARTLDDLPVIEQAIAARWKMRNEAAAAESKAKAEAKEAARLGRVAWEVEHPDEARTAYRAEALAKAKDDQEYQDDEGNFDQAAFDAAYELGKNGEVGYGNPKKEFFERWRKEHHTIWPGHMELELDHPSLGEDRRLRQRRISRAKAAVNLDHIEDMKKARKLFDAADNDHFEAMCTLADFMKIERPSSPSPNTACDYKVDPTDAGHQDRWNLLTIWEDANEHYIVAKSVLENKLWRFEEPKEAAEQDRKDAKRDAETKKRLIVEAKSPTKTKAKALKEAKRDAMDGDMEEEKESCRENGERWGDVKEQWIENWEAENWDEDAQAQAEAEFLEDWEFAHGKPFPASKYGKGHGARAVDG